MNIQELISAPESTGCEADEELELDFWCETFGCSEDALVDALLIAGPRVPDLLRQLGLQLH